MRRVGQYNKAFYVFDVFADFLEQRHEHRINEYPSIFGMIDNIYELVRKQARIDGVANIPGPADSIINFQVPVVVPRERRHPIAVIQTQFIERVCELARAIDGLPKRVTMSRIVSRNRDNFPIAVKPAAVFRYCRNQQRSVHHQALHERSLFRLINT